MNSTSPVRPASNQLWKSKMTGLKQRIVEIVDGDARLESEDGRVKSVCSVANLPAFFMYMGEQK